MNEKYLLCEMSNNVTMLETSCKPTIYCYYY